MGGLYAVVPPVALMVVPGLFLYRRGQKSNAARKVANREHGDGDDHEFFNANQERRQELFDIPSGWLPIRSQWKGISESDN